MDITKCDICKKTIKREAKTVRITGLLVYPGHFEFCEKCGAPIMEFLNSKKLTGEKNGRGKK